MRGSRLWKLLFPNTPVNSVKKTHHSTYPLASIVSFMVTNTVVILWDRILWACWHTNAGQEDPHCNPHALLTQVAQWHKSLLPAAGTPQRRLDKETVQLAQFWSQHEGDLSPFDDKWNSCITAANSWHFAISDSGHTKCMASQCFGSLFCIFHFYLSIFWSSD